MRSGEFNCRNLQFRCKKETSSVMNQSGESIDLYKSEENSCNYLDGEISASIFANPYSPPDWPLYTQLIQKGFRRSGEMIYRPDCTSCRQCISVRLKVSDFSANRRFRRTWNNNHDIKTEATKPQFTDEYFALYRHYLSIQHAGGDMENPTEKDFSSFLITDWTDTVFLESRLDGRLLSVAVTDIVLDGLSSVYTFYEPEERKRSLGNFSILCQIELCRQLNIPYLYLGYWISGCQKMAYKNDFSPLEYFYNNQWLDKPTFEQLTSAKTTV